MINLNMIEIFACFFILWELIKLILSRIMWEQSKIVWFKTNKDVNVTEKNENPIIKYLGISYLIFCVVLLFTPYYGLIIGLVVVSIVTFIVLLPYIKNNEPFSTNIFVIMLIDFGFSVFLLSNILI